MPQSLCVGSAGPAAKGNRSSLATGMKRHSIHTQSPTDGLHPVQLFIPIPATPLLATTTSLLTKHAPERTPPASPFSKTASCKKRTSCFVLKLQIDVGPSAVSPKQPGKRGGEEWGYSALRATRAEVVVP